MEKKYEAPSEIESILLDDLKLSEDNPMDHTKTIPEIIKSIEEFGWTNPIEIDKDNVIIAGHGRYKAAKKLGLRRVPCIRLAVTEEGRKRLMLVDNKIARMSSYNKKLLKNCMTVMGELEASKVPGYNAGEIDKIFGHKSETVSTSEGATANFGEAGDVVLKSEGDDRALIKRKTFVLSQTEHKSLTGKLNAIKKEYGLKTEVEALFKALEDIKPAADPIIKKGPLKVSHG